jgi:hypothetical protein
MRGKMLWFNEAKDLGFIMTDDGERLAVLGAGFARGNRPKGRCAHQDVTFEISENGATRHAEHVRVERDAVAHRPRIRSYMRGPR